jgi:hypothetical protein
VMLPGVNDAASGTPALAVIAENWNGASPLFVVLASNG